jgi:hypothetical protein
MDKVHTPSASERKIVSIKIFFSIWFWKFKICIYI